MYFSPDGRKLVSGSHDHTIKLWNIDSGKCLHTLYEHTGWVLSVCFSPNGKILASGSYDNTIKLWNVDSGISINTLQGHDLGINGVYFSPDGTTLASGSYDKSIKLWNVDSGICINTLQGHNDWVNSVCFSPDGTMLASCSHDKIKNLYFPDLNKEFTLSTLFFFEYLMDKKENGTLHLLHWIQNILKFSKRCQIHFRKNLHLYNCLCWIG